MKRLCALAIWCVAAVARAQSEPRVSVGECPGIGAAELSRLLAIELRTLDPVIVTRVREVQVRCQGDGVEVVALPAADDSPVKVSVSLRASERASLARLLALRISEELTTPMAAPPPPPPTPTPAPPPDPEPPPEERAQPAPQPFERGAVSVSASTRRVGEPATWLGGLAVGYLVPLSAPLALQADGDFALGTAGTDLADLSWRELGFAIALLARLRSEHVDAALGPGFRANVAWLAATEVDEGHAGREMSAVWAGPLVLAQLGVHGRSPWQAVLGVEGGYVIVPIEGSLDDSRTLLSITGLWISARAGTAYRW
jgi:hypothetical protein